MKRKSLIIILPTLLIVSSLIVVFRRQIFAGNSEDSGKSEAKSSLLSINSSIGNMNYPSKNTQQEPIPTPDIRQAPVDLTPSESASSEEDVLDGTITPEQKKRIFELTSLFENDTIQQKYDYIENLDDGRGYTAGIAGFTTADGDLYDMVNLYTKTEPGNPLAKYLSSLKKIADDGSDSTSKLSGFKEAWAKASSDPVFKTAQDEEVDITYYQPAMKYCDANGLKSPLAKAIIYDTIIQHGDGDDPDSLSSIIKKTNELAGGTPKSGISETVWLKDFLKVRKDILKHATDKSTREVWAESTGRCDVLGTILDAGNVTLQGPIKVKTDEYDAIIP